MENDREKFIESAKSFNEELVSLQNELKLIEVRFNTLCVNVADSLVGSEKITDAAHKRFVSAEETPTVSDSEFEEAEKDYNDWLYIFDNFKDAENSLHAAIDNISDGIPLIRNAAWSFENIYR